jgi:hypothetical protein
VPTSTVHPTYNILQSSKQMARVQTSWPLKGVTGDSSHHVHFTLKEWEAAVKSTKPHLRRILGSHCQLQGTFTSLAEIQACANSRHLCALSSNPLNRTHLSPGHLQIGEALTQLSTSDHTNVTCNRLLRWQTNKNRSSKDIHLTIGSSTASALSKDVP